MNTRHIHIFYNFSKAIRQFVWLFTCFVRVVNLKLFLKQTLPIPKRPHNLKKSSNLIWHYLVNLKNGIFLQIFVAFSEFWNELFNAIKFAKFCWASSKIQRKLYSNQICMHAQIFWMVKFASNWFRVNLLIDWDLYMKMDFSNISRTT